MSRAYEIESYEFQTECHAICISNSLCIYFLSVIFGVSKLWSNRWICKSFRIHCGVGRNICFSINRINKYIHFKQIWFKINGEKIPQLKPYRVLLKKREFPIICLKSNISILWVSIYIIVENKCVMGMCRARLEGTSCYSNFTRFHS